MATQTPTRIVVREYERIRIGPRWDSSSKTITHQQANQLEAYQQSSGKELFDIHRSFIKAKSWVGSIGIGNYCIDVVPKIDSAGRDLDEIPCMENLLHMVSACGDLPFSEAEAANLARSGKPLVLAFMETYVNNLSVEWRRGRIQDYVSVEENRPFLKGKLLFSEQLRRNLIHKERLFTRSDEFISDNPYSRVLKAALRLCGEQLAGNRVARNARALLPEFDGVSDIASIPRDTTNVATDRRFYRFDKLLRLARMIIDGFSPAAGMDRQAIYSLMFDMNIIFEKYIAAELRRSLAGYELKVSPQITGRHLLRERGGRPRFLLRPDIGIKRNNEIELIIDTKWKRLDESACNFNISQADIYQVYAYGKEFDSPRVILLYPRHSDIPARLTEYQHNYRPDETPKEIVIATVDVSRPLGKANHRNTLREELRDLVLNQRDSILQSEAGGGFT
jgi:5-methylcytosine-specific restriction enzyme subunit McrC